MDKVKREDFAMIMEAPKVEFVEINLMEVISTSNPSGGGQRCIASQIDAHDCADFETSIPWTEPEN